MERERIDSDEEEDEEGERGSVRGRGIWGGAVAVTEG